MTEGKDAKNGAVECERIAQGEEQDEKERFDDSRDLSSDRSDLLCGAGADG